MEKDMNFFDLCVACGRAIGRACVALWHVLERMIRLTYRYWYIVITLVVLALACAVYLTRKDNITYRVNAVAMLNGASIQQFDQAFAPLQTKHLLPSEAPIGQYLYAKQATHFKTFRVIDALDDGTADFIDFKHKIKLTDTLNVPMKDRLCIQFCIKTRDMALVPEIEQALLATLNSNAVKLDSLTSAYYFQNTLPTNANDHGVYFSGDRRVRLFLNEIYKQQEHMKLMDYRLQLATAPVVLENHFAVDPKPKIGRLTCMILFFLMGWIGACLLAGLIDRRKEISAWLKA